MITDPQGHHLITCPACHKPHEEHETCPTCEARAIQETKIRLDCENLEFVLQNAPSSPHVITLTAQLLVDLSRRLIDLGPKEGGAI